MTETPFYYGCNQNYLNGLVVYVLLSFFPYRTSKLKPSMACTLICAPSSHVSCVLVSLHYLDPVSPLPMTGLNLLDLKTRAVIHHYLSSTVFTFNQNISSRFFAKQKTGIDEPGQLQLCFLQKLESHSKQLAVEQHLNFSSQNWHYV